jgi:phosphate transport system substrate-binding protein
MRSKRALLALIASFAFLLAACGGGDQAADSESEPGSSANDPADVAEDSEGGSESSESPADGGGGDLSGEVIVSGSSTVEPISARNAEKFAEENPDVAISVDGPGTGDGFEIFCAGQSDVSDASRPIAEEEIAACEEAGIEFIELTVGIDGLSVITSPENDQVECLSFADLYALLGPESTGFNTWAAANDLASQLPPGYGEIHAPYPDVPLAITAPGEESGTFDSFVEIVLEDLAEERGQESASPRPDYQASPNDNVIIEGISGSPTSLGWVGYAFVQANPEAVKALPVDGGEGCVEPTPETIASGEFPIARPLFIYVNAARAEEKPELEAYIDYYMSDEGFASVTEVGYVALDDEVLEESRSVWESRETGTRQE